MNSNKITNSKTAKCVVFTNHKGGTGRTTSCLSIAGYLAKKGSKVLVFDLDPQANATSGLGIDRMTLRHTMYDAALSQIKNYSGVQLSRMILKTKVVASDFDGNIIAYNKGAHQIYGYTPHEVIGKQNIDILLPPFHNVGGILSGVNTQIITEEKNKMGGMFEA